MSGKRIKSLTFCRMSDFGLLSRFSNLVLKGSKNQNALSEFKRSYGKFRKSLGDVKLGKGKLDIVRVHQGEILRLIGEISESVGLTVERDFRRKYPEEVREQLLIPYPESVLHAAELIADNRLVGERITSTIALKNVAGQLCDSFDIVMDLLRIQAKKQGVSQFPIRVTEALINFDTTWCRFEFYYIASQFKCKSRLDMQLSEEFSGVFYDCICNSVGLGLVEEDLVEEMDAGLMLLVPRLSLLWVGRETPVTVEKTLLESPFRDEFSRIQKNVSKLSYAAFRKMETLLCASVFETSPPSLNEDGLHELFLQICSMSDSLFTGEFGSCLKEALSEAFKKRENEKPAASVGMRSNSVSSSICSMKLVGKKKRAKTICEETVVQCRECAYCGAESGLFRKLHRCECRSRLFCGDCINRAPTICPSCISSNTL